jgi:hypothetical protein
VRIKLLIKDNLFNVNEIYAINNITVIQFRKSKRYLMSGNPLPRHLELLFGVE